MEIYEQREPSKNLVTMGSMWVDDAENRLYLFTLEDQMRPEGVKVDGETAIRAGSSRATASPCRTQRSTCGTPRPPTSAAGAAKPPPTRRATSASSTSVPTAMSSTVARRA